MSHRPINRPVERGIGLAPGTNFDTGAATGPALVSHPHAGALLFVHRPFFIAVEHLLVAVTDGATGAFTRALLAFRAEILEPEVDGFVRF